MGVIGDGKADITMNSHGIRETGTFVKTIALLPYLKQLGINTIHLLPITEIGIEGRKGNMGSPYAIKNPFKIDPLLGDPIVTVSVEDQYKALIEAAHLLGIRVVQEFIFRTASIDSDWSAEHPGWFYWIRNNQKYAPPKFTAKELEQILKVPKGKGKYIPPAKSYRALFDVPPGQINHKNLKIASAFADWPPDDLQPPWSDVTYLRLFHFDYVLENNYNYIAYNTIRFYDPELANEKHINHELWDKTADIIPYYQKTFGIDGAMIDMGHALPNPLKSKIITKARDIDPNFAFWDENFDNKEETRHDGYNAVIGDAWYKITKRNGLKNLIKSSLKKNPLPSFGASETHNSPRYGFQQMNKKKAVWLLFNMMPNAVPFLHNGFELNEYLPVNTGLNFSKKESDFFTNQPLALFYKSALIWDTNTNIVSFIIKISAIKLRYPWIFDGENISILKTSNPKVLGFQKTHSTKHSIVLFNTNFYRKEKFSIDDRIGFRYLDLLKDKKSHLSDADVMNPGEVLLALST